MELGLVWTFKPTTTGWSEVTLTLNATSVVGSGYVWAIDHSRTRVAPPASVTVLVPVSPGYFSDPVPGMTTPARLLPLMPRMLTPTFAADGPALKT